MAKGNKEYEIGFKIAADMEADFVRTFSAAAKSVEGVQEELKQLQRQKNIGDTTKEMREGLQKTHKSFEDISESAKGFGETVKRVAEYTGAFKLVNGVAESFSDVVGTVADYQGAMRQIQASTGASAKDLADMQQSAERLYNQNLGEDFNDLSDAISKARQVTGLQGEDLEETTKDAIVYKDVFEEDLPASLKTVDTMMKNFGVTSDQAFNLLAQGAQNGLDKSGDLLDTANEYSVYFKTLGYTAEEMFDQFGAGIASGAFNLDKVGDAVKEFGIRIKDGSDTTAEAMAMLFAPDDIEGFTKSLMTGSKNTAEYMELLKHVSKDTADQLVKDLKDGGKKSEDAYTAIQGIMGGGNKILSDLASGSIKGRDAMQQVITKLQQIKDPVQQSTLGVALFGTQFEDMEAAVISSLGATTKQFDMAKNTMQEIADIKYDTAALSFQGLGRQLMTEYVIPLGKGLLPKLAELSDWLSENKGLVKNALLALAAGGAVKGIAKVTGSIAEMSATAAAGGKSLGLLRSALGLTNPLGIAVTAIGAVTFGIMEFRRQQEEARKELLNLGSSMKSAYSHYEGVKGQTQQTKDLIKQYDVLTSKISDVKTPTAELAQAREQLKSVEEKLIELNPDILKAEDAKTGKFREQLGLADRLNTVRSEEAKRDLEKAAIDNDAKLPELEKEYQRLTDNLSTYNQAYADAKSAYVKYQEYVSQQQSILQHTTGAEQIQELRELANQIASETGKDYSGNWANLAFDMADFKKQFDGTYDSIRKTEADIATAKDSFQSIYDTQKRMIELNLGGTLEEQSKKMSSLQGLTADERDRLQEALKAMNDLNKELSMIPAEKQVNVKVLYKNAGFEAPKELPDLITNPFHMPKFAGGGVATRPSIFGEAGPEMAIPLDRTPRSRALLEKTNQMLGYSSSQSGGGITYNPTTTIIIQGNADQETVKRAVKSENDDFEKRLRAWQQQKERVSMAT